MFPLEAEAIDAILLSLRLSATVTGLLLFLGTPLAWWLARTRSPLKGMVEALVVLPLFLPPTVLGFYMLLAMGPQGPIGALTKALGLQGLPFTFSGLVVTSMLYSVPFVVQPLQNAFASIQPRMLEAANSLRAGPWVTFGRIVLPLSKRGFLTAAVMGFAHTIGEFGVVLMVGGNIPGETRLVSIEIYDYVEAFDYPKAHALAGMMVAFAFCMLLLLYGFGVGRDSLMRR
ncbi:MAG: molybdate ABC transporter permease subunit [Methylococcus sp.]|jgi:molybdate transport system permease protein|nr:MAG: molybdate ABC transporter permease subunit [Methylococcus sp.]